MRYRIQCLLLAAALAALLCGCTAGAIRPAGSLYEAPSETPENSLSQTAFRVGSVYIQNSYLQRPYIFKIGWNINRPVTGGYASRTVTLGNGETLKVYFDSGCADLCSDRAAMSALNTLLTRQVEEWAASGYTMGWPLVLEAEYIGDAGAEELAERAYREERVSLFAAVLEELDAEARQKYVEQSVEDGRVAYLSVCLEKTQTDAQTLERCLERAYQQRKVAVFSILMEHLEASRRQSWVERAAEDGRTSYLSISLEETQVDAQTLERCLERAYQQEDVKVFSMLVERLEASQRQSWAERAAAEGRTEFAAAAEG